MHNNYYVSGYKEMSFGRFPRKQMAIWKETKESNELMKKYDCLRRPFWKVSNISNISSN